MDSKQNESNLFADFLKVFTGLIIGLASFQILAPLIWNYLSELLHLEKYTSYIVIISFYFILPGILLTIWWFGNKHKLTGLLCIHPDENANNRDARVIQTLSIFLPLFFLVNALLFLFGFLFDNSTFFYSIQITASVVSAYLLIKIIVRVLQNLKAESVKKKRKHHTLIALIAALFLFFVAFQLIYFTYIDKTKEGDITTFEKYKTNNKAEILNAFRLNDFKEELISVRKKFEFNLDRIRQMQDLNNFNNSQKVTLPANITNLLDSILENKEVTKQILNYRNRTLDNNISRDDFEQTNQALLSLTFLLDRVSDSIAENAPMVTLHHPPYKLQKLLGYQKIRTINQEDSASLSNKEKSYERIITSIRILESNLVKLCTRQLNIVLNNNQMKGIFLFAFALVIMLCFYLLLKTNEDIFRQLQAKEENKNNEIIINKATLNKGALSDVWIIVNILVWLLIPLLKPVTEDSIKIDKPFQSLTINKYIHTDKPIVQSPPAMINSQNPFTINSYASGEIKTQPVVIVDTVWIRQELQTINDKIDQLELNDTATSANPLNNNAELIAMLRAMQTKLNAINSSAQDAKTLRKLHRYLREGKNPDQVNDGTFKPN